MLGRLKRMRLLWCFSTTALLVAGEGIEPTKFMLMRHVSYRCFFPANFCAKLVLKASVFYIRTTLI